MEAVLWIRKIDYPRELLEAENRNPKSLYVKSVKEFYEATGYITKQQSDALCFIGRPKKRRASRSHGYYEPCFDDCPGDFGMEWW